MVAFEMLMPCQQTDGRLTEGLVCILLTVAAYTLSPDVHNMAQRGDDENTPSHISTFDLIIVVPKCQEQI